MAAPPGQPGKRDLVHTEGVDFTDSIAISVK
jgi:hypothetical protein